MKGRLLLLTVGVCLVAVTAVAIRSSAGERSKIAAARGSLESLNVRILNELGDSPSMADIARANALLATESQPLKDRIRELRVKGHLRKNSDTRIDFEELVGRKIDKFVDRYDAVAKLARRDLEKLNDLKAKFVSLEFNGKNTNGLRQEILDQTDVVQRNYEVIEGMEAIMEGLKNIYEEINQEEKTNA